MAKQSILGQSRLLPSAGIELLRFRGLNDGAPLGIWTSPSGASIGWFHDPDKNLRSSTRF
jgi:hypothetical protein